MAGPFPRAIDFQVAHHEMASAAHLQEDERVGHEHSGSVKHVRVMLAIGHHQQIFRVCH